MCQLVSPPAIKEKKCVCVCVCAWCVCVCVWLADARCLHTLHTYAGLSAAGVMGAIIPWNYPFHNMYGQIISALFAGNGIVLKVSEYASW